MGGAGVVLAGVPLQLLAAGKSVQLHLHVAAETLQLSIALCNASLCGCWVGAAEKKVATSRKRSNHDSVEHCTS
jgi:hypothetical protein